MPFVSSRHALLVLPSANRVYGRAGPALACAELHVLGARDVVVETIAGLPYVMFAGLDPSVVACSSAAYALFTVDGGGLLRPVVLPPVDRFDDDLVTIQRYTGKTNEQFTRLLLNVGLACAGVLGPASARVLDPVAGRGTTLNHALLRGLSCAGVERDAKAVDAYEQFLSTWLKDKRLKHKFAQSRVRRDGKVVGRRFDVVVEGSIDVAMVADDTRFTASHFKRGAFDAVVADLPYGVQHAGRTASGAVASRSPAALVEEALAGWVTVLRAGGAMALACNVRTLPAASLAALLEAGGLRVVDTPSFEHRVDQAIQRDVVVAVKP